MYGPQSQVESSGAIDMDNKRVHNVKLELACTLIMNVFALVQASFRHANGGHVIDIMRQKRQLGGER